MNTTRTSVRGPMADAQEIWVVALAKQGDQAAFGELVARRQAWIRHLMWRLSGDPQLADDLAQQVFLQAWKDIRRLREANRFGGWLKRLAINVWLKHQRKVDPLFGARSVDADSGATDTDHSALAAYGAMPEVNLDSAREKPFVTVDLERALATLAADARVCVVLAYHEGMSHQEIATLTTLPLGTVKSHVRRATQRLQTLLADYAGGADSETGGTIHRQTIDRPR